MQGGIVDSTLWIVARWEYMRYFKWKSELISIGLIVLLGMLGYGGSGLISFFRGDEVIDIHVINPAGLTMASNGSSRVHWLPANEANLDDLMRKVGHQEIDGLLKIFSEWKAHLTVFEVESWQSELTEQLNAAALEKRLASHELTVSDFRELTLPVELQVEYHELGNPPRTNSERIMAFAILALMVVGVVGGFGLLFMSITSEKQQRITEQVTSAISTQTWMDGKILGITAMSLQGILVSGVTVALGMKVYARWSGNPSLLAGIEASITPLWLVAVFAILGLVFWNCFVAAIAAMVEDPNTTTKTPMMLLPIIPLGIGFAGVSDPNNFAMQGFSIFPLTSMGVMPVRLIMGNVGSWQIVLALILLVLSTYWIRTLTGRIFRLSMLMYGKEPKWSEIVHWMRESKPGSSITG
jgi:ABC-2 type transport system permease protein